MLGGSTIRINTKTQDPKTDRQFWIHKCEGRPRGQESDPDGGLMLASSCFVLVWPRPDPVRTLFICSFPPPSPGGVAREGPDCRFPSEAVVWAGSGGGVILILF